ncbi:hypothetical protein D3C80_1278840 [compost metagenome]
MQTGSVGYIFRHINAFDCFFITHKVFHADFQVSSHLLHNRVRLGVYTRCIQRMTGIRNAQESCTLFKSLITQARHFKQLLTAGKLPVLTAVLHNILCNTGTDTTYIR